MVLQFSALKDFGLANAVHRSNIVPFPILLYWNQCDSSLFICDIILGASKHSKCLIINMPCLHQNCWFFVPEWFFNLQTRCLMHWNTQDYAYAGFGSYICTKVFTQILLFIFVRNTKHKFSKFLIKQQLTRKINLHNFYILKFLIKKQLTREINWHVPESFFNLQTLCLMHWICWFQ